MLTIFPEVYKLTYALLDVWNGTGRLPEVNAAMLRLQDTFDEACAAYRPAARAFGAGKARSNERRRVCGRSMGTTRT